METSKANNSTKTKATVNKQNKSKSTKGIKKPKNTEPARQNVTGIYFESIEEEVRPTSEQDKLFIQDISNNTIKELVEISTKLKKKFSRDVMQIDSFIRHRGLKLTFNNITDLRKIRFVLDNDDKSETIDKLVDLSKLLNDNSGKTIDDEINTLKYWKCNDMNIDITSMGNEISIIIYVGKQ